MQNDNFTTNAVYATKDTYVHDALDVLTQANYIPPSVNWTIFELWAEYGTGK